MLNHWLRIKPPILAGALWFVIIFALGFLPGMVRVLARASLLGEIAGMALEVLIILGAGWIICRAAILRPRVSCGSGFSAMPAAAC